MAKQHGAWHLADNPQLYEPARSNNFEFVATGIGDLLKSGLDDAVEHDASDYITNAQETIRVSVVSSSVPHYSVSPIEVKRGNDTIKFAGTPRFSELPLVVNDYMGARTKDAIMAWQALAYNVRNGHVNRATNYKKECRLIEFTPDYKEILREWVIEGAWVSEVQEGAFSNEEEGKRTVTATIVFDRAYLLDSSEYTNLEDEEA